MNQHTHLRLLLYSFFTCALIQLSTGCGNESSTRDDRNSQQSSNSPQQNSLIPETNANVEPFDESVPLLLSNEEIDQFFEPLEELNSELGLTFHHPGFSKFESDDENDSEDQDKNLLTAFVIKKEIKVDANKNEILALTLSDLSGGSSFNVKMKNKPNPFISFIACLTNCSTKPISLIGNFAYQLKAGDWVSFNYQNDQIGVIPEINLPSNQFVSFARTKYSLLAHQISNYIIDLRIVDSPGNSATEIVDVSDTKLRVISRFVKEAMFVGRV